MDTHAHGHGGPAASDSVIDPVCGMTVDPHTTPHRHIHQGRTYYFCSAGCRAKFATAPAKYLTPAADVSVPADTIYTCPMHPEVRQVGPGACPICGMALEPEIAAAAAGPNPELASMARRFWIALVLAAPVAALDMGGHFLGERGFIDQVLSDRLQFLFATRWCFGAAGRSSCAAGNRSSRTTSICSH